MTRWTTARRRHGHDGVTQSCRADICQIHRATSCAANSATFVACEKAGLFTTCDMCEVYHLTAAPCTSVGHSVVEVGPALETECGAGHHGGGREGGRRRGLGEGGADLAGERRGVYTVWQIVVAINCTWPALQKISPPQRRTFGP